MAQAGKYLRTVRGGFAHYCPSCKELHILPTGAPYNITWSFNGDLDKPSFSPSFRHHLNSESTEFCHYIITGGVINFCGDQTDPEFRDKAVAMPEMPSEYSDFGE